MIYKAIGVMSGSSGDGLDVVYAQFHERGGKWEYYLEAAECFPYPEPMLCQLQQIPQLDALAYKRLDIALGRFIGEKILAFMEKHGLHYRVDLIGSHGHTGFHRPEEGFSDQLGNGAVIAAMTGLPVVTELRMLDVALGGQGAPIVPVGEKCLFANYPWLLNIGGIANLSFHGETLSVAFDVCPANQILNRLAMLRHQPFDRDGELAASGHVEEALLHQLNAWAYYDRPFPKSMSNEWIAAAVWPLLEQYDATVEDKLATFCEHISVQLARAIAQVRERFPEARQATSLLATGGGVFHKYLLSRIRAALQPMEVEVVVPDAETVKFKEALIMAFLAIRRWREESTTLASVTGARYESIGGALWIGHQP
ncbi:MAG: anhydro-N-acetylmuramic acid kinase [Thermoflavifilum aggregans]|nr:anhydro-N-acetylmuramic acid kinase [Thermoflavifilum aggregans]